MTTVFIGDIHGCAAELSRLLEKIGLTSSHRLILLGDLVNKGPDPSGVLSLVRELDCICLRGNHENDHLKSRSGRGEMKAESRRTRDLMTAAEYSAYLDLAEAMPLYWESDVAIAVHGALEPGVPLDEQRPSLLTGDESISLSWKDGIDLGRPLVVGHKRYSKNPAEPCVFEGRFYGIDTACIYGGALTALALPSGKIWQVDAARDYAKS